MSEKFLSSPNLRHLRNEAKSLSKRWLAGEPDALLELRLLHPSFELLSPSQLVTKVCLHNAQLALARRYGFQNWPELCSHVAVMNRADLSSLTPEQIAFLLVVRDESFSIGSRGVAAIQTEKLANYERGRPRREDGGIILSEKRGLTLDEALNDRARIHGMPPVGTKYTNAYGIEWKIESYEFFMAPTTFARYPGDCDYLPIVKPLNPSMRLQSFISEVDRCTSKWVLFLDTMPKSNYFGLGNNIHCAHISADPTEALIFLDVKNAHETTIAHELAHLWVTFVEGLNGERVLRDRKDNARKNLLDFIQSFVLDIGANDLIEQRGFDMSLICQDQFRGLEALRDLMMTGFIPPSRREPLLYSLQIAGAVLEQKRWPCEMQERLPKMREFFEAAIPEIYNTALEFVEIVTRCNVETREGLRAALEECTVFGFRFTDNDFDIARDTEEAITSECMQDKFPQQLAGAPVALKLEINKARARLGLRGDRGAASVSASPSGMAMIILQDSEKGPFGPIQVNFYLGHPDQHADKGHFNRKRQPWEELAAGGDSRPRVQVDPNAPNRHIPFLERPEIRGMIPDDYGRLPGDNGYNTSFPPGQDPFSQMQNDYNSSRPHHDLNNHSRIGGLQYVNGVYIDEFGRRPSEPGYMTGMRPGQLALPTAHDTQGHGDQGFNNAPWPEPPGGEYTRRYMAGLARSVVEARLAQQMGSGGANLYQYVLNNPVKLVDPSGLAPSIDPPSDCKEYTNVSAGLAMACAAIKSPTGKACISRLSSGYADCISGFCSSSASIHCGSHSCAQQNCDPTCAPNCCYYAETNPSSCNITLCTATIGQSNCLAPASNVVQNIALTLLHEYMHCCGMLDHSRDGKDPNNPAEDVARCIMGLPGHLSPY